MKLLRHASLSRRMNMLTMIIMVPLTALVLYLLVKLINFSAAYSQSVQNITAVKDYSMSFKADLDYSMYRAIAGNYALDVLDSSIVDRWSDSARIRNPYTMINEMKNVVMRQAQASGKDGAELMRRIDKSLGWLERVVEKIDDNIQSGGHYAENIELLDKDIRSSTQLIQDNLQEYIYYETVNLENIRSSLELQARDTLILCTVILTVILALVLILTRMITRSVTQPVRELCAATQEVAKGNFTPAEIESGDEIQVLTKSFNDMTEEIRFLIENIKKEQRSLRDTELKLLQAQINPHFLYNTLDAIVWMAEGGQDREVVAMVTALSEFFRTGLSEGKDFIMIREEEAHIRSYLSIQEFRYADILDYEIEVDPKVYDCRILKLTLQPLVENALYHGIKNKRGRGMIRVRIAPDGDRILLVVSDNGIGMDEQELTLLRSKLSGTAPHEGGFGLENVNERIRLNYGPEYGITFESVKGEGTTATVCIPRQESKENLLFYENNELKNA